MAPSRKSRSVHKRFSYVNEVSHNKDAENASKVKNRENSGFVHKKRKVTDMLGPQWTKEELERFYEAYRRHGKDWKKVATAIRNRSVEMVKALYTMNKAYLSLPEGIASVVGLIAMMTDHYNVLESESEQESNEGTGASQKTPKRGRVKVRNSNTRESGGHSPDQPQSQPASIYGCLSLLKKKRSGTGPRAVGKRTPRVPVSYSYAKENGEKYCSPRQISKAKTDANDVAHEIALVLTEASQRGVSPQASHTPNKKLEGASPSAVWNGERMHDDSERTSNKFRCSEMDEGGCEISLGSTDADNGDYAIEKGYKMELKQKGKGNQGKKPDVEESVSNHFDDVKEACSGTEEGQDLGTLRGKSETDATDVRYSKSSCKSTRKKSKKVLFGEDAGSAFDALQALADLSLMMPSTATDTESSVLAKEGNLDATEKSRLKGARLTSGSGGPTIKTPRIEKSFPREASSAPEADQEVHELVAGTRKRKQRPFKIHEDEDHKHPDASESHKIQAKDDGKKHLSKSKRSSQNTAHLKQGKSVRTPERSSSTADYQKEEKESPLSAMQVQSVNQVNLPTKVRSKRKKDTPKLLIQKDQKHSESIVKDQPNIPVPPFYDGALGSKALSNCLSSYQARRWCVFEWFYSAIDYPWFAKREFIEYLNHVGLGHAPRLTQVEWGVIKSSLGKPRRFSEQFLKEEREKLGQYRESVRKHYAELRAGTREELPSDLAQPLSVGQRVIAIHPRTREIHDGSILTVEHSRCRVQFDLPQLGVEFVKDIDCMPLNPSENMPANFTRKFTAFGRTVDNSSDPRMNAQLKDERAETYMKTTSDGKLDSTNCPYSSPPTYRFSDLLKLSEGVSLSAGSLPRNGSSVTFDTQQLVDSQPYIHSRIQSKEADIQALSQLTRALDMKEALVVELRRMNDNVLENQKDGDDSLKNSEPFKKHYAAILLQLNEANEQVTSALVQLRQRNTYQGNSSYAWMKPTANLGETGGQMHSLDHSASPIMESGSHVAEIVESSRTKARTMVEAALQAIASLRSSGGTIEKIEEAIDHVNNQLSLSDTHVPGVGSPVLGDPVHGTSFPYDRSTGDAKLYKSSSQDEVQIPSELIARCVATLLMIQRCTERQFPPADVAKVLDSAVTSLHPCSPGNLPIYAEIQKCMGIIKNQILALIPT